MSEKVSGNAFDIKIFLRLMSYAKGYKLRFFIAAISTITLALVSAVNPYIVGITVNDFVNNQDIKQLTFYIQILSAIVFAEVILQFLFIYYANWVGQHIIRDIRAKVFRNSQNPIVEYPQRDVIVFLKNYWNSMGHFRVCSIIRRSAGIQFWNSVRNIGMFAKYIASQ